MLPNSHVRLRRLTPPVPETCLAKRKLTKIELMKHKSTSRNSNAPSSSAFSQRGLAQPQDVVGFEAPERRCYEPCMYRCCKRVIALQVRVESNYEWDVW